MHKHTLKIYLALYANAKTATVTAALTILDELFLEGGGRKRLLSLNRRLQGHELPVLRLTINPDIASALSAVLLYYHLHSVRLSASSSYRSLRQLFTLLPDANHRFSTGVL